MHVGACLFHRYNKILPLNAMSDELFGRIIPEALKSLDADNEEEKSTAIDRLGQILSQNQSDLRERGYDRLIFQRLMDIVGYSDGQALAKALDVIHEHFIVKHKDYADTLDQIMETLLRRTAMSNEFPTVQICAQHINQLVDNMGSAVAKHSKQLLQMVDSNNFPDINHTLIELLNKIKCQLPATLVP
ncbi:hypothetical protein GZH46_00596 [Fragariocoptes setiger]|uniref:Uncharacterized protein n=1 Tax=Fragariocoptes setiger TaxID=1670756 RepID=A0ABQ7SBR2_9ACAR|nr:hypothetical protein GZH46_00596 [Fragariocoptes setiger]